MTRPAPAGPPVNLMRAGSRTRDVLMVLKAFRAEHGWAPGLVWDPTRPRNYDCTCKPVRGRKHGGRYVTPAQQTWWPAP